jgi:Domain of unknown function (DUF4158)
MRVAGLPAYPFPDTTGLEPCPMASMARTAYPRFKAALSAPELQTLYAPTEEERAFVAPHTRTATPQLTLLTLLKCHQSLGYLPAFETIPAYIRQYLCHQLSLAPETALHTEKHLRSRYRHLIRSSLAVTAYADGGPRVVEQRVTEAAYTMSDPADLLNVAIEHLIQQRIELPAFQTLDRLVSHGRYEVHQTLYTQMTATLSEAQKTRLDALISVHAGRSEFTRIKDTPRRATLKHLRQWTERLTWLESILTPQPFLRGIAHTKMAQLAAEAAALDLGDISRDPAWPAPLESPALFPPSRPGPDTGPVDRHAPQAHAPHHHRGQRAAQRAARATS